MYNSNHETDLIKKQLLKLTAIFQNLYYNFVVEKQPCTHLLKPV